MANQSMFTQEMNATGYVELTAPQMLDDKWRQLNFDLASSQNILGDLSTSEYSAGYVYRDAHQFGTAAHNRFIYWRTACDVIELVEMSTESDLDDNQVRIKFLNAPIINDVQVIELSDSVVIIIATTASIHRLVLPHPHTTNSSILHDLTNDVLYNSANYYILNNARNSSNSNPICAASWHHKNFTKCAVSFPDSSILIVQFGRNVHHVVTSEIKQAGIIGRLWSRMPNLLAKNPNDCDNAVFACAPYYNHRTEDTLLFTLCRDCKIRVFSTKSKDCVYTHNMIPQSSFSQSFASYTNPTTEPPQMRMLGSVLVVYMTEAQPEFVLLSYICKDGIHSITEKTSIHTPRWQKLITFALSNSKIWAFASENETESVLYHCNLQVLLNNTDDEEERVWSAISSFEDLDTASVKNYVLEIFWRNNFSLNTVQKGLATFSSQALTRPQTMWALEQFAHSKIVDKDQEAAWARLYNYCLQNHLIANKNLGLVVANDESVMSIVKRSNPSFICPWPMSADTVISGEPYRGIEFSATIEQVLGQINHIAKLLDDEDSNTFDDRILEDPCDISSVLETVATKLTKNRRLDRPKLHGNNKNAIINAIDSICDQLDLTAQSKDYGLRLLDRMSTIKSEICPLGSSSGVILTFELLRQLVRARMHLARDLLVYIYMLQKFSESEKTATAKTLADLCKELYASGKVKILMDSLRSYALLKWITDSPIKSPALRATSPKSINFIASCFKFFKTSPQNSRQHESIIEQTLDQNLLMNFLINGGTNLLSISHELSDQPATLSNSYYVTEIALNLCMLLWPKAGHLCFAEFLLTHQLDEHLNKYLNLTSDWISCADIDRQFIRAANHIVQDRPSQAIDIFNRLWAHININNFIYAFLNLDKDQPLHDEKGSVLPIVIYQYYKKLIQLFRIPNNQQCLVKLINHCLPHLDHKDDVQEVWIDNFRAELFSFYLELDDTDGAYHAMIHTNDPTVRMNCLRKFIVNHCEKEQWSNLLSYPFINIKHDLFSILIQKAEGSDLSKLNKDNFYKTTYYDLLFTAYITECEYRLASEVMYNYAHRLAQEVPGLLSIKKQGDCLLIALNSLRCVSETDAQIEYANMSNRGETPSIVMKRAYNSEAGSKPETPDIESIPTQICGSKINLKDIKQRYELTRARQKLLEHDQAANSIALSPLKPEEIINQLVSSSMYSTALDIALLFKCQIDPILEGLTSRYIYAMNPKTVDIIVEQDVDRCLQDVLTDGYRNIDTYNYIANSSSAYVEKIWRLIDHYLNTFDGISHRYSNDAFADTFSRTTVLMIVVARKLLSSGHSVPASLRRMYLSRNPAELLKLLIKYDKLIDASELATEMIDRVMEPTASFNFTGPLNTNEPPPIYLPTHLILLLIAYLKEDATSTNNVKAGDALMDRINRYRYFIDAAS